jgi:hypothetical protein
MGLLRGSYDMHKEFIFYLASIKVHFGGMALCVALVRHDICYPSKRRVIYDSYESCNEAGTR